MADKKIKLKDLQGNLLFPQTKGELVQNASGQTLENVEAGAQVNKIEVIKVNGVPLQVVTKAVEINIPAASVYTIAKKDSADEGFSASYQLTKDGEPVGTTINIPKDMFVQSGSVKEVEETDVPVEGYQIGQKYIDLLLANGEDQHIYVLVNDLVDTYTAGTGITISSNTISVDTAAIKTSLESTFAKIGDSYLKAEADEKFAAKATTLTGYGITDAYTKTEADGKFAAKSTTLAGYGIGDAYTKTEIDGKLANTVTYEEIVG